MRDEIHIHPLCTDRESSRHPQQIAPPGELHTLMVLHLQVHSISCQDFWQDELPL
jgi:hypothetical protein